jgi:hypothetical protein
MKKNNTNIDKYFQKARNQEVNFSKDDARNLIENNSKIINNSFGKFTGVKKMTTISASIAGAVLLAVLTFNPFGNTDNESDSASGVYRNEIKSEVLSDNNSNNEKKDKSPSIPKESNLKDELIAVNSQKTNNTISTKTTSIIMDEPLETNGINLINLSKEEFTNIGIDIVSNDEFEFVIPSKKNSIKYRINLNDGMNFEVNDEISSPDRKAPTFISRENGEKIFGRLTLDDNSMEMVYSKIIKYDTNEEEFDMNVSKYFDISQFIEENKEKSFVVNNSDSAIFKKKINVIIDTNTDTEYTSNNIVTKIISEEMKDSLLNPENSEILIRKVFDRIEADSTLKEMAYNNNGFNFDIDVVTDTIDEDIIFSDLNVFDDNIRVNKLLPLAYAPDGEVQYIFWFDPDIELIKKLPEKYHSDLTEQYELIENDDYCETVKAGEETYFDILRSCSGTLKNLSAYPNPSDGAMNVKFMLEEPSDVSISLHKVSGEKIMNLITNKKYQSGNIEEFFDISDLPAGMYALTVATASGDRVLQRIVKR